ncbi:hypothetical protein Tsubulata_022668 [Turnera subulata]|uniref:Uncharacterized protein n=1 Tax=Turnera subulata TaxID=218843 RepID=A0A9Q0F6E0_9ROSI|nr:hypothetical protein Tsubulata_022668 [Turnera subulata]
MTADEVAPLQPKSSEYSSSSNFDFCFHRTSICTESSSADELFLDGKIIPTQILDKNEFPTFRRLSLPLSAFGNATSISHNKYVSRNSRQETTLSGIQVSSKEANHGNNTTQNSGFSRKDTKSYSFTSSSTYIAGG